MVSENQTICNPGKFWTFENKYCVNSLYWTTMLLDKVNKIVDVLAPELEFINETTWDLKPALKTNLI
jgi:hypothetical protein